MTFVASWDTNAAPDAAAPGGRTAAFFFDVDV
jgi:hypothetical protein